MQPAQKRFLTRFAVFLVGFYALVAIRPVNDAAVLPFTGFLVKISAAILRLIGEAVVTDGTVIRSPLFAVDVKNGCNGIEATLLLLAAMLAFPAPAKARASGVAIGFLAIQAVNFVRIVSLFWLGAHRRDVFDLFHAAIWQTLLILLAVGIFLAWGRRLRGGEAAEAGV
ncbi:MAG: exosortase H [Thermoanaerobaculia bacterium]|jgi:exosortase H (IPTLxxWG-CTERM-specific)